MVNDLRPNVHAESVSLLVLLDLTTDVEIANHAVFLHCLRQMGLSVRHNFHLVEILFNRDMECHRDQYVLPLSSIT